MFISHLAGMKGAVLTRRGRTTLKMEKPRMDKKRLEKQAETPRFDSDFSPGNPHNIQTAEELGVIYDRERNSYIDEDGCLMYDQFGQPI